MEALVYDGPEVLNFRDMPRPDGADGDTVVRVHAVGICGSDMHAFWGHDDRRPAPLILGHEVAGVIETGPRAGERVTVNPLVTPTDCPTVQAGRDNLSLDRQIISMPPRQGGFAQYISLPDANLIPLADHLSFEQGALAEPIACGWHCVRLVRETAKNLGHCLVIGGGAIGLGAALCAKAQGANAVTIMEPNALRATYLRNACGQTVVHPDDLPADQIFDTVIDGVGYPATRATATAQVKPGGVIGHIGLGSGEGGLDIRRMTLQEITFIGTYTYTMQDFR
ncbi:MAG: alcohol dehydrogenase catalytic domain-containing protein, partial [Pseudomonadota bacterium]